MAPDTLDRIRGTIRDVPDFPNPGILFKDITPVLATPELMVASIDGMRTAFNPVSSGVYTAAKRDCFSFGTQNPVSCMPSGCKIRV